MPIITTVTEEQLFTNEYKKKIHINGLNRLVSENTKTKGIDLPSLFIFERKQLFVASKLLNLFKQINQNDKLLLLKFYETGLERMPSERTNLIELLELAGETFGHVILSSESAKSLAKLNELIDKYNWNCSILPQMKSMFKPELNSVYFKADLGNSTGAINQMENGKIAIVEQPSSREDFTKFDNTCSYVSEMNLGRNLYICTKTPEDIYNYLLLKKYKNIA